MKEKNRAGKWTKSQWLQFAAFMVAAPRWMGLGAMALAEQPGDVIPFFLIAEIASWLGFAVLEGIGLPYIAKGIRRMTPRSFEWWQLQCYRAVLLLAIPGLGAPLYWAISRKETMLIALGDGGFLVWAALLTGLGAIIIDAVGTVESVNEPETAQTDEGMTIRKGRESHSGPVSVAQLAEMYAGYYHEMTPDQFIEAFERDQGKQLSVAEAEAALRTAREKRVKKVPAPRVNGNGVVK